MNPSKSLMALLVAASLLAAAPARAAVEWVGLTAGKYTFYIQKDKLEALKKDKPGAVATLYRNKRTPPTKAQSTLSVKPDGSLQVNLYSSAKKTTIPTPAKLVAGKPAAEHPNPNPTAGKNNGAQTTPPQAPARPASIKDGAVWQAVVSNPNVKPERREATALALQSFKSSHPDAWTRLSADPAKLGDAVAGAAERIGKNQSAGDVDGYLMSASAAANGGGQTPNVTPEPVKDDQGKLIAPETAINTLIDVLNGANGAKPDMTRALRERVAERFNDFILDPKKRGDQGYIAQAVFDKDKDTHIIDRIKTAAGTWIAQELKPGQDGKAQTGAVAELYFVMGDAKDLPAGLAQAYPSLLTLKPAPARNDLLPNLETLMKVYTNEKPAPGSDDNPGADRPGQYAGQDSSGDQSAYEAWWLGFYNDAALKADKVLKAHPIPKIDITKLVGGLDDGGPVVPGGGAKTKFPGGKDANDIMTRGFSFDDVYIKGAVSDWIEIPGHPGQYRRISIKMYSAYEKGVMVDKIGIFDVTEPGDDKTPSNIYGRRIALNKLGESDIQLDDTRPDSLHYKVNLDGTGKLSIVNSDGNGFSTTVSKLYDRRHDQVADSPMVTINGQNFYVSYQGAPKGLYTYYGADASGKLPDGRITPAMIPQGCELGASGFTQITKGYQPMGNIGKDKDGKDVFYLMKWNDSLGKFEYKSCDEAKKDQKDVKCELPQDTVPPPAPPADTSGGSDKTPKDKKDAKTPAAPTDKTPKTGGGQTGDQTGTTDKTNGEDNGSGSDVTACKFDESNFSNKFKKISVGDYKVFLNNQDVSNAFHICMLSDKTIFTQGIPVGGDASIRSDDSNLIVETVSPAKFIPPEDIIKGHVKGNQFIVGDGTVYDLNMRSLYYIDKGDLNADTLKSLAASGGTTYMDKAAWVRFQIDSKTKVATDMEIHLREIDADKAVALVDKGFKLGNAAKSTFNNPADLKTIEDFVRGEVVRYKNNSLLVTNPNITIHLNVNREVVAVKDPTPIVTIYTAGQKNGTLPNGDPDIGALWHEQLQYCYYPNPSNGNKAFGLETGAAHKDHTKVK